MIIKPSTESWVGTILLSVGVIAILGANVFIARAGFYEIILFMLPIEVLLALGVAGNTVLLLKTVKLCPEGYWVSFCGIRRLCRWEEVKTKRLEDYTQVMDRSFNNARFPEGAIFSVRKKNRPLWMHPALFLSLNHPFSSFYVSFQVEEKRSWSEYVYWDDYVIVDKKELLDTLHSFGVELDVQ